MKLYAYRFCPYSRRVRIALAEHGVDYEYVELAPDAEYPQGLRGLVPGTSGVPVLLVRDDFALWDSAAIVHWIDSSHPRSLFPSQRDPQAIARSWQGWAAKLYPSLKELREGDKQKAVEKLMTSLRAMESMVSDGWLVGNEFTIADAAMGPLIGALDTKDLEALPSRVRAYAGRLRARPSVREVCELDLPADQRPSFAA